MVRKLVTLLMLFIASANVTFAAGMACEPQELQSAAMCVSEEGPTLSSSDASIAPQHPQDDNCGDTSKHPQPSFHHCHFGHCGVIVTFTKFAPFVSHSEYGFDLQNLALKSFIANIFRPPIA